MSRSLHDYALLSDAHGAALVARDGSIDWCCLPRFDHGSCFARLLGDGGGHLAIVDADGLAPAQRYLPETMVLETMLHRDGARARMIDALAIGEEGAADAPHELIRVIDGLRGRMELAIEICVRLDYGAVRPWLRHDADGVVWAIGGDDGLLIRVDGATLQTRGDHDLVAHLVVEEGRRARLSIAAAGAAAAQHRPSPPVRPAEVDARLERTIAWWRRWAGALSPELDEPTRRSALVLRALTYEPTGALLAAPTTSLPEAPGGERNWDYRYSWIRDSAFAVRSAAEIGWEQEPRRYARFALRSAAGHADELQVVYGAGGERHLDERELDLAGYGGAWPVRVGNRAAEQLQLDALGELVRVTWAAQLRGERCDADEWRFVASLVETAARRWREPDHGVWEWRAGARHFVHSKACCWAALQHGLDLARELDADAPVARWRRERDAVAAAIARDGWDAERGTFRQAFGGDELDASVLLLPAIGLVDWNDARMVATADVIAHALDDDGLVRRHDADDGLRGREGAFLACSFWLAELYANQGRVDRAQTVYDRAMRTASPLGLLAEEHDPRTGTPLGNYPQALTHLAQICAALAIRRAAAGSAGGAAPAPSRAGADAADEDEDGGDDADDRRQAQRDQHPVGEDGEQDGDEDADHREFPPDSGVWPPVPRERTAQHAEVSAKRGRTSRS